MSIIDDASRWGGNTTITDIRFRLGFAFGWDSEPTQEQVRRVLNALLADDLIVKDGATHEGARYALTFKGKRKLAHTREYPKAA